MNKDWSQHTLLHMIIYGYLKRKRETAPELLLHDNLSWIYYEHLPARPGWYHSALGRSRRSRPSRAKRSIDRTVKVSVQASEQMAAEVEVSFPWRAIEKQVKILLWECGGLVRWLPKIGGGREKRKKKELIVKSFAEYKSSQARPGVLTNFPHQPFTFPWTSAQQASLSQLKQVRDL